VLIEGSAATAVAGQGVTAGAHAPAAAKTGSKVSLNVIAGGGVAAVAVAIAAVVIAVNRGDSADAAKKFAGTYRVTSVTTAIDAGGGWAASTKIGESSTGYWTVAASCKGSHCTATVTINAGRFTRSFVLEKGVWIGTSEATVECGSDGDRIPGTLARDRWEDSIPAPAGTDVPAEFRGTETVRTTGGPQPACPSGEARITWNTTLTRIAAHDVPASATAAATPSPLPTPNPNPAPAADRALAAKAVAVRGDLPTGWKVAAEQPDAGDCDLRQGSPALKLGQGARKVGERLQFGDTQYFISSVGYVFTNESDAKAFVTVFKSADYLKCLNRQRVATLASPPVGASFRSFRVPANDNVLGTGGYEAYIDVALQQISGGKYIDAEPAVDGYSDLSRYGRVVSVTTIDLARQTGDPKDALQSAGTAVNEARQRLHGRVTATR